MGKQSSVIPANSRYGWRWALVLVGVASWVSIGCTPQSLYTGPTSLTPSTAGANVLICPTGITCVGPFIAPPVNP